MRSRLTELTTYLREKKSLLNIRDSQIDAWMENAEGKNAGGRETEKGINAFNLSYSGLIYIEEIQKEKFSLLIMLVQLWLLEKDDNRFDLNLASPKYQVVPIDDKKIDVEITIEFLDEFYIGKDEAGPAEYNGEKYSIDSYELWTAEELESVQGEIKNG